MKARGRVATGKTQVLDEISHEHAALSLACSCRPASGLSAVEIEPEAADEAAHAAGDVEEAPPRAGQNSAAYANYGVRGM